MAIQPFGSEYWSGPQLFLNRCPDQFWILHNRQFQLEGNSRSSKSLITTIVEIEYWSVWVGVMVINYAGLASGSDPPLLTLTWIYNSNQLENLWSLYHLFTLVTCRRFKFIECDVLSFSSQPDWSNNELLTLLLVKFILSFSIKMIKNLRLKTD